MPRFPGLIGGSYPDRAIQANPERAINWYPARLDSPGAGAKSAGVMRSKPGLSLFCTLQASYGGTTVTASQIYLLYQVNGTVLCLSDWISDGSPLNKSAFWIINYNGTSTLIGAPILPPGNVATYGWPGMVANQNQVLITCGGGVVVYNLGSNSLTYVSGYTGNGPWGSAALASPCFLDGYFLARQVNSQVYWMSNLNDATTWNGLNFGSAEGQAGNIEAMIVDHRLLWFIMTDHAEAYYDIGGANFPMTRLDGAVIPQGIDATGTLALADNTFFWVSGNSNQGYGQIYRAAGYVPQRVSSYALENAMQSFPTIADASGYCYQENGETFYRADFPSAPGATGQPGAGQTWVLDCGRGLWHERAYWNVGGNYLQRDLAGCHTMLGDMHLVGDYQSGRIYVQSASYSTDNGTPIWRSRITPSIANGGRRTFYGPLTVLVEVDEGLDGNPSSTPALNLQVSNDGGQTWTSAAPQSLGSPSAWNTHLRWPKLGSSFNRAYQFTCTEKLSVTLIDADHEIK
jgi:hypothetical protein